MQDKIIMKENGECWQLLKHYSLEELDVKGIPTITDEPPESYYQNTYKECNFYVEKNCDYDVVVPTKSYNGDAGFDFYFPLFERKNEWACDFIEPLSFRVFDLGIKTKFDEGYVLLLQDRSGLAAKNGLTIIGCVIDSNYRGNIHVTIFNCSRDRLEFIPGQKIVQGLLIKCNTELPNYRQVDNYYITNDITERNQGGIGSTGNSV